MLKPLRILLAVILTVVVTGSHSAEAQTTSSKSTSSKSTRSTKTPVTAKKSKFQLLTAGKKKVSGLFDLYYTEQKLYVVIKSSHLNKNFIILPSIARGISSGMVLGGMTWGFGDDILWTFRKVGDKIHVIRRNVHYRAKAGTPEAAAVKLAYSDSVLYALPILTSASGGYLVDMTRIFMSDDLKIGRAIGRGFRFASDRSTWAKVKAFPKNIELEVAAVYSGLSGPDTVSDPRGVQVGVHYSISLLPSTGYKPRLADDRVGYFLTAVKDFSDKSDEQHFVRYVNRWDLQKKDPKAKLSPPKTRIVFYMEKTVPVRLRPIVRAGIEEWNRAFEKLGFSKAIEVRQQEDDATWDPEDVRYNTFRWITAEAGFAMGPSRVNPLTGQIIDADIIFDASFLRSWTDKYETFTPADAHALMGGVEADPKFPGVLGTSSGRTTSPFPSLSHMRCGLSRGMRQQVGFASSVLTARGLMNVKGRLPEKFIHQGLKEVVMHEVGHTLGLRHNFKASTWKSLKQIDDPVTGASQGTVASVMDYAPANIAPKGVKQGLYYSQTIGPYDYWAIEYGYKPKASASALQKIASRGAEPGHDYATDEDTGGSDPLANRFDLGKNPVEFAERQMRLSAALMPVVVKRSVKKGQGFQRARRAFGLLFSEYWRSAYFAARFPGGVLINRDHKGDVKERAPFQIVNAAQQRAAMKLLARTALASPRYDADVLNHLAASRWSHWGMQSYSRLDYPIHDFVQQMQSRIIFKLTSGSTLSRLQDNELKVSAKADVYTLAEHLRSLYDAVFTEFRGPKKGGAYTDRKPLIPSFRRNLQRVALKDLAVMVTSGSGVPEDARTLSRMHLSRLDTQITALLKRKDVKLDDYSRAHLLDSQNRIRQVLNAQLQVRSIN